MSSIGAGRTRSIIVSQQFNVALDNPNTNSSIRIQFPQAQSFINCELALANLNLFYSWYNVQAAYGNNTFSYLWPTGSTTTTFTVVIPDGSYDVAGLNAYLQFAMQQNGTYLLQGVVPVFYLSFSTNLTYYRTTLTSTPLPTSLPTGYTLPANYPAGGLPTSSLGPRLVVPATGSSASSFSEMIGFVPGTYPSSAPAVLTSLNGTYPPEVDTVTSVNVICDVVNNGLISQLPNTIYSFSPTVPFGSQITIQPPQRDWFRVVDSTYATLTLTLTDQVGTPLPMQDPVWSATLLVRQL